MHTLLLSHRVVLCVLFLLFLAATANAQFKASVQGTVTDTAGAIIADATVTLIRRLARGHRIWEPHRAHFYQKLVQLGLGHGGTLALYAALMAGTSLSAVTALLRAPAAGMLLLGLWAVVLTLLYISIDYSWRKSEQHTQ